MFKVVFDLICYRFNLQLYLRNWFHILDVIVVLLSILGIFDYATGEVTPSEVNHFSLIVIWKSIVIRTVRILRLIGLALHACYIAYSQMTEEEYEYIPDEEEVKGLLNSNRPLRA